MGKYTFAAGLTLAVAAVPVVAMAANLEVIQDFKSFSPKTLEAKVGDVVYFVNKDYYDHNVYSEGGGNAFNIGIQAPGDINKITLNEKGQIMVRCRIHPKMKLEISVRE